MASTFRFKCPMCQARIKASFQLLGQTRPCPKCTYEFLVQPEPPEDSGPLLVEEDFSMGRTRIPAHTF